MGCVSLLSVHAQVDEVEGRGTDLGLTDEVDGIVHLAVSNPHRIRRYDTVKRNWINPIKLSSAPDAIAATSLGTYGAFGDALVIVGSDREEATILRTSSPIISLAKVAEVRTNSGPIIGPSTFKDVLVIVSETELVTYDLSFGREISRRDLTGDSETILPLYEAVGSDSAGAYTACILMSPACLLTNSPTMGRWC
ncbi:MAG: hypothetical protein ACI8T1_002719 [Verrucomicrobiales bacterium]|jgi:hypothetical protein